MWRLASFSPFIIWISWSKQKTGNQPLTSAVPFIWSSHNRFIENNKVVFYSYREVLATVSAWESINRGACLSGALFQVLTGVCSGLLVNAEMLPFPIFVNTTRKGSKEKRSTHYKNKKINSNESQPNNLAPFQNPISCNSSNASTLMPLLQSVTATLPVANQPSTLLCSPHTSYPFMLFVVTMCRTPTQQSPLAPLSVFLPENLGGAYGYTYYIYQLSGFLRYRDTSVSADMRTVDCCIGK